jgi:hypothetical protein
MQRPDRSALSRFETKAAGDVKLAVTPTAPQLPVKPTASAGSSPLQNASNASSREPAPADAAPEPRHCPTCGRPWVRHRGVVAGGYKAIYRGKSLGTFRSARAAARAVREAAAAHRQAKAAGVTID